MVAKGKIKRESEERLAHADRVKSAASEENTAKISGKASLIGGASQPFDTGRLKKFVPAHLSALQHQLEALAFTIRNLEAGKPTYLALEPGLGKTIIAALISNYFQGATIFYVCPPFLTSNTNEEFTKWTFEKKLYLLPDSMIAKPKTLEAFVEAVRECKQPILIVDEAHRFKNESAQRSRALFKNILPHFERRAVFMSGTPLPNSRPKELWGILKNSAPKIFGPNFFSYGLKYCGGFRDAFGWNFDGFTNRKEFKARLTKSFMLRMRKDVLNLPPKVEGLLTVGEGIPPLVSNVEKKILAEYSPEDLVQGEITRLAGKASLHLATYLRLLGEYKLKYVLPFIESLLEETKESFIIFAVHKETIAKLQTALAKYEPLVVTGDVAKAKRHGMVKEFQSNPERRIFIGNIQACGVGFTLTKATRVIFVEFSWVDGENSQAADRAHRIGQGQSVLVQYVVLKDSFDRQRMETLLKKRALSI